MIIPLNKQIVLSGASKLLSCYSELTFDRYQRIKVIRTDDPCNFRIGGNAPENVVPSAAGPHTRYFLTIPLFKKELSIFISMKRFSKTVGGYDENRRKFVGLDSDIVQFVLHDPAIPGPENNLKSECHQAEIKLGELKPDLEALDEEPPSYKKLYTGDKIGGNPSFMDEWCDIAQETRRLIKEEGYFHLLQLNEPDVDLGEWLFVNDTFHVIAKASENSLDVRCIWG